MGQHTPGPWEVDRDYPGDVICEQGDVAATWCKEDVGKTLRIGESAFSTREEAEANARIIAAAPELLEALKSALKTAEFERHPYRPWHGEARAAIVKAKGA